MEALAGSGVTYQRAISPPSSYALKPVAIPDLYASVAQYRANCAPINDGEISLDYLKPEQRQYAAYLSKAAEIVLREPYCQEVQLVDFSGTRSAPKVAIIFVQYVRAPNKCVNRYLTLPVIDQQFSALGLQGDV